MKVYMVHNHNRDANFLPNTERYRLFEDLQEACSHAQSIGFKEGVGLGVNTKVGMMTSYWCGEVRVEIYVLEVKAPSSVQDQSVSRVGLEPQDRIRG